MGYKHDKVSSYNAWYAINILAKAIVGGERKYDNIIALSEV